MRIKQMKRKHYRDLSIDEPLSHVAHYKEIEAEVRSASPEQKKHGWKKHGSLIPAVISGGAFSGCMNAQVS